MFRNTSVAFTESEARRITNDPTELTLVYVYNDDRYAYDLTEARRVVCTECGADAREGDEFYWHDEICPGDGAFLVCLCGEQFTQTLR
jgi:hypothetical protein